MFDFLENIIIKKKMFMSVETRRLVEKAFMGLVEDKRDAIRKILTIGLKKENVSYNQVMERYLLKLRLELAYDCQKVI